MQPIRIINIHHICILKHAAKSSYLYDNRIHKDKNKNKNKNKDCILKLHPSHTSHPSHTPQK